MQIVLNEKEARAIRMLAEATIELNKVWSEDWGQELLEHNLLPSRNLLEVSQILSGIAVDGVLEL